MSKTTLEQLERDGFAGPDREDLPHGRMVGRDLVIRDVLHVYMWCRMREITREAMRLAIGAALRKIVEEAEGRKGER